MVFSSLVFLCIFLPAVVGFYAVCPGRLRNLCLLLASLLFYAWGEPRYIFILLFSTVFDYMNGRLIGWADAHGKRGTLGRFLLVISIAGNLGILGFFKYTDFFLSAVNRFAGSRFALPGIALPIGISFYTFQTMSYTIDVYRGKVRPQKNLISFGMYVCLFPQLIAGPIVRYSEIETEITERRQSMEGCAYGLQRFLLGLGKKVLLANQAGAVWEDVLAAAPADASVLLAWLGAAAYMFQIYFDFSGYSDMAIGLGRLFGFHFPENFDYPYVSKSITEFWRRWHMTLGRWFREYVYIPLGGSRRGTLRQFRNLFLVWALTGLWHGAGWNFLLWGMYFCFWLILEKQFLLKWLEKWPAAVRHMYAIAVVLSGWVVFACEGMGQLKTYIKMMAGRGVPFASRYALYLWSAHLLFFLLLAVACTGVPKKAARRALSFLQARFGAGTAFWAKGGWCALVLFLSLAMLVSGSYNPFLYFRF